MSISLIVSSTAAPLTTIVSTNGDIARENSAIISTADPGNDLSKQEEVVNQSSDASLTLDKPNMSSSDEKELQSVPEEETEKIIEKIEYASLYKNSNYSELSDKDVKIKVTGNMPENAIVKAYEINNPDIDNEKDQLLAFGIEIFNKDGSRYDKSNNDSYQYELTYLGFIDTNEVFMYEKGKGDLAYKAKTYLSHQNSIIKFDSRANQFAFLKEKQNQDSIDDKMLDNQSNIDDKNLEDLTSIDDLEKDESQNTQNNSSEGKLQYQQVLADIYMDSNYLQRANDATQIKLTGNLPGYTKVRAYPVKANIEGVEVLAAYDITVFDKNNQEYKVTSDNNVKVTIKNPSLRNVDEIGVYHKEDSNSITEEVKIVSKAGDTLVFEAPSFSQYIVYNFQQSVAKGGTIVFNSNYPSLAYRPNGNRYNNRSVEFTIRENPYVWVSTYTGTSTPTNVYLNNPTDTKYRDGLIPVPVGYRLMYYQSKEKPSYRFVGMRAIDNLSTDGPTYNAVWTKESQFNVRLNNPDALEGDFYITYNVYNYPYSAVYANPGKEELPTITTYDGQESRTLDIGSVNIPVPTYIDVKGFNLMLFDGSSTYVEVGQSTYIYQDGYKYKVSLNTEDKVYNTVIYDPTQGFKQNVNLDIQKILVTINSNYPADAVGSNNTAMASIDKVNDRYILPDLNYLGDNAKPANYKFLGWSKSPNATSPDYQPGDNVDTDQLTDNITLYAIWAKEDPKPVPTGIIDNMIPMILLMAVAVIGFAVNSYSKSKKLGGIID